MERIRNEYIRGKAQVQQFVDKVREARLGWKYAEEELGYLNMKLVSRRKR